MKGVMSISGRGDGIFGARGAMREEASTDKSRRPRGLGVVYGGHGKRWVALVLRDIILKLKYDELDD